jgi:hypothetical protein
MGLPSLLDLRSPLWILGVHFTNKEVESLTIYKTTEKESSTFFGGKEKI